MHCYVCTPFHYTEPHLFIHVVRRLLSFLNAIEYKGICTSTRILENPCSRTWVLLLEWYQVSTTNLILLFYFLCTTVQATYISGVIIEYSRSTLNTYSLLSHKLWVSLIKYRVMLEIKLIATWVFGPVVIPSPKKPPSMRVWVRSPGSSKYTCVWV